MSLGPMEIVVIIGIVLIFFGPSRLPALGKSVGEAIRGFKKGLNEVNTPDAKYTEITKKASHLEDEETETHKKEEKEKV